MRRHPTRNLKLLLVSLCPQSSGAQPLNALQQIQGPPLAPFGAVSPASTMSLSLRSRTAPLGENFSSTLHPHSSLMLTPSLAYVSLIGSPFKLRILTCTQRVPSRRRVTFIVNKDSLRRFPTPGLPRLLHQPQAVTSLLGPGYRRACLVIGTRWALNLARTRLMQYRNSLTM